MGSAAQVPDFRPGWPTSRQRSARTPSSSTRRPVRWQASRSVLSNDRSTHQRRRVEDYKSPRLRVVTRETLKKELPVPLRRFAKWGSNVGTRWRRCQQIETPSRHVLGTRVDGSRKRTFLIFTADEMAAIIGKLPQMAQCTRAAVPFPVRARFIVAWETALRPQTIDQLRAPDDYRRGGTALLIRDEVDKNRFGRELRLAIPHGQRSNACAPTSESFSGPMTTATFSERRRRPQASMSSEQNASATTTSATRASRAGQQQPVRSHVSRRAQAARYDRAVPAASKAGRHRRAPSGSRCPRISGLHSGRTSQSDGSAPERSAGKKANTSKAVRGRGLEPRWLLTASTSS